MSARTLFWICWINSLVWTAQSQITRLSCPSFVENTLVRLSLEVDNSSFSSCSIGPTTVTCYFTPANGTKSNICGQSVEQCNIVPTPDECVCMGSTDTGYKYSLNFTARQADHGGGDFSCNFDCIILPPSSSTPPSVDIAPSCLKIAVVPPATTPPNTTTDSPGTTSTESPSSNTATSDPTTQHTGSSTASSPSEAATETTGNVSSATTASSEPSSSPSSISGPTTTSTENGSTNKPTGNVSSTTGPASDLALYAGLGFVGLVCLVGIVVVIVLIVRRRKRRKDVATNSGNQRSPDQRGENNYAYNNTAL